MKKMFRDHCIVFFLVLGFGAFPLLASAQTHIAQGKPIRIIVPFGAGGIADLTARLVGQKLSEQLGQPVVIENKPGAGGIVGGEAVAKGEADGSVLLLMSNASAVSTGLFKKLPFDVQKDFAPISSLGFFDLALVSSVAGAGSNPSNTVTKIANITDLLTYARANPGKLNVGSINIGSTQNLAAELLKTQAGIEFQVVPYNGTPALLTGLRSGDIDVAIEILGPLMPQIDAKVVRPLATMGKVRANGIGNVPTAIEAGIAGFQVTSWNMLAAPTATPKAVITRLQIEIAKVLALSDVKKRMAELHVEARVSTPEEASELLASEIKRWGDVIVRAKIPKQ